MIERPSVENRFGSAIIGNGIESPYLAKMAAFMDDVSDSKHEESHSSSSTDEDYCPVEKRLALNVPHSDTSRKKKRKELKAFGRIRPSDEQYRRSKLKRKVSAVTSKDDIKEKRPADTSGDSSESSTSFMDLPSELILVVLSHVVSSEGAIPFLIKAGRVCRLWRDVASAPQLWHSVSFQNDPVSSVDRALSWVCQSHASHVISLQLIHCRTLTRKGCLSIQTNLAPTLKHFLIDSCANVRAGEVVAIANQMQNISTFVSQGPIFLVRTTVHIGPLLRNPLKKLKLNICSDLLQLCHSSLNSIDPKFNQRLLQTSHLHTLSLTAEQLFNQSVMNAFQRSCPNLKELTLQFPQPIRNFAYITAGDKLPEMCGFPNLSYLSVKYSGEMSFAKFEDFAWECNFLEDILSGNPPLNHLVLGGFTLLPVVVLCRVVPPLLESLSLTRVDYVDVIHSIVDHFSQLKSLNLNIANVGKCSCLTDTVLESIARSELVETLEQLSVVGSDVTDDGVRDLLQHCHRLTHLNLEKCRSLSRGMKQKFTSDTLENLKKRLSSSCSRH